MKKTIVALFAFACLSTVAIADHHEGGSWFDMEKCGMCKHMAGHQELMMSMKWETHLIDNGMMSIATIPDQHKATMESVHQKMKAAAEQLKAGKEMHLCGFCDSYGKLMDAGAKEQEIETEFGMVALLTSDQPELADKIKKHAKRTQREYKAMLQAAAAAGQ